MYYYEVALNAALKNYFTYASKEKFEVGTSVVVPVKTRTSKGVILSRETSHNLDPKIEIKEILESSLERPVLPELILKWARWLSEYYFFPLGLVLESCFPPLKKGGRKTRKSDVVPEIETKPKPELTQEQAECVKNISSFKGFKTHLLFGVTGSGKTEVYLRLLEKVILEKKSAFMIVPEISLTPQIVKRFSERFQNEVAVIHSHLTPREKTNQWWSMIDHQKKILIGARSALFCPVKNLGLIILDEEHESSYKQDEKLRYHGRDAAIKLAQLHNCPIVLGSATPSIESWNNVKNKRFELSQMTKRVAHRPLPDVHIVDLKKEQEMRNSSDPNINPIYSLNLDLPSWLSMSLYNAIKNTLKKEKQVALFLNRRGVAQTTLCTDCGYVYECPNCAISLTLHGKNQLHCHYCDYGITLNETCPSCHEVTIKPIGIGTEQVQTDIKRLFPEACCERADRDEIQNRENLEKLISKMESREIDILVGTQMIAKGLDFPYLTTVGILLADVGLNLPDFRSSERAFQLLTQVSGRSGRHSELPGQVYIQTYNPQHLSIEFAQKADYLGFSENEIEFRRDSLYPPFSRLVIFKITGTKEHLVLKTSKILSQRAHLLKEKYKEYEPIHILGPAPAPILKIKNKYRYQLLIKGFNHQVLHQFITQLLREKKWVPQQIQLHVDIDPLNML